MGKALAEAFPAAREVFERVDAALSQKLSHLMFEGPEAELTLTANAQPALMAVSMAALRALEDEAGFRVAKRRPSSPATRSANIRRYAPQARSASRTPRVCCACAARRCRKPLPSARARWRRSSASISARRRAIATQAASDLYLTGAICAAANDNGGGQVVISGTKDAVERAMELAKLAGAKRAMLLPVSAPFHCPLMQPAALAMETALKDVKIGRPRPPLVANVTASAVADPKEIRQNLVAQVTGTVRWRESVDYMSAKGVTRFIEVGAGKVLAGLIKRIADGVDRDQRRHSG